MEIWQLRSRDSALHELIHTKVAPPLWMGTQIARGPLLDRLDEALNRRLTVIHAPAGYGKTSLLSQWRRRFDQTEVRVAWLTLERDESDLKRLAQYVSLAINAVTEDKGESDTGEPISADLPPRAALSAIINRLAREPGPVVLIVDDLHRAENKEVAEFLKSLIHLAPTNAHFIIASRDDPWLGQSILRAEEQLLELTAEDLKFSEHEAEALLARSEGETLDGDDLRSLVERTEGWPIALQLTSLSLKQGIDHKTLVERFSGSSSELARYLSEQVLMTLPEELQELVMRTALLDQLSGDIVNLLCGRNDGWLMLEHLEQQGLFLTPLSPERQGYRYHQLFAEYLRERLARRDSSQYQALQRCAARWFAERGQVTEAVSHAIQAGDDDLVATMLEDAGGWRLIPHGRQSTLERGLNTLSDAVVAARPRLMLAKVYLQIKRGEMSAARSDYDRFVEGVVDAELSADMRIEIRVVGDVLADYENVPVTLDDLLAREALLRTLPADDHLVVANVSETLGAKYYEGGRLERALEPTLAAREHYQRLGSLYSDLFTRFLEARIKRAQGRSKDAADILAAARAQIEESFGERSDLAANCAAFEAQLLYEQDRAPEAMTLLEWALPHMEQSDGWVDVYAAAYFTAARALGADTSMEDARMMLARAQRLARRRRFRQLELLAELCELELLIHHSRDSETARSFADSLGLDALADEMAQESPVYRAVACGASLCRAKLALREGNHPAALVELRALQRWGAQHGAGRLLIEVNFLIAFGRHCLGEVGKARASFDEAVSLAMFQGLVRPFIDGGCFVLPLLQDAGNGGVQVDRYRAQFLKTLSKSLAGRSGAAAEQGLLTDAEAVILRHLSNGHSNKEIARLIGMSPDTVKYRLKAVYKKIGVNKRREAVRVSHERGLLVGADR